MITTPWLPSAPSICLLFQSNAPAEGSRNLSPVIFSGPELNTTPVEGIQLAPPRHGRRGNCSRGASKGAHPGAILSGSSDPIVASNSPLLEWEAYVPPQQTTANGATPSRVTYDLWIWQNRLCSPSRLVYAKTGLSAPRHQVERQLMPATGYFWAVRARIQTGGETRLTEWNRVLLPTHPITRPNQPGSLAAFDYFRFVTPGGVNDESKSELANWKEIFAASTPSSESEAGNPRAEISGWGSLAAEFPGR